MGRSQKRYFTSNRQIYRLQKKSKSSKRDLFSFPLDVTDTSNNNKKGNAFCNVEDRIKSTIQEDTNANDEFPLCLLAEDEDDGLKEDHVIYNDIEENDLNNFSQEENVIEQLREWAVTSILKFDKLKKLLKILKPVLPNLPIDPRTFKRTPVKNDVIPLDNGGTIAYLGLKKGIETKLESGLEIPTAEGCYTLTLQINIDGLSVFKSTNLSMWPILCSVNETVDKSPFVVSLFTGIQKPPLEVFFDKFVEELKLFHNENLSLGFKIDISKCLFICDAPAKAFIKGTVLHNAYYGCERCTQRGSWHGRVCFLENNSTLRTNESFRNQAQPNHHRVLSPLLNLDLDIVCNFPFDYMHLVCLGVVRRLLMWWIQGPRQNRISRKDQIVINNMLSRFQMPNEFSRKPRSLNEIKLWKATEFRQFLLYTGPVVLKKNINSKQYHNFILLHNGIKLLLSNCDEISINKADDSLKKFVRECLELYGKEFITYNVHSLTHLADDVRKWGSLERFSAFKFENLLGKLKCLITSKRYVTQQVVNRISELSSCNLMYDQQVLTEDKLLKLHHSNVGVDSTEVASQYSQLQLKCGVKLDLYNNNCILLQSGKVFSIKNIVRKNCNIYFVGYMFEKYYLFFKEPIPSSYFYMYKLKNVSCLMKIAITEFYRKCILFDFDEEFYVVPLMH